MSAGHLADSLVSSWLGTSIRLTSVPFDDQMFTAALSQKSLHRAREWAFGHNPLNKARKSSHTEPSTPLLRK
jgi:hypothetical protein